MNNLLVFCIIWGFVTILILGQSLVNTFSILQVNERVNNLNIQVCSLAGGNCQQNSNIMVETYYNYWDYIVSGLLVVTACFLTVFINAILDPEDLGNIDVEKRTEIIGLIWAVTFTLVLIIISFWEWVYPTWIKDTVTTSPDGSQDESENKTGLKPLEKNVGFVLTGLVIVVVIFLTVYRTRVFKGDNIERKCGFMWLGAVLGLIAIDVIWGYTYRAIS
jgi:hypothetical protein